MSKIIDLNFWKEKKPIRSDILVSDRIIKLIKDIKGKKVIDLGCGTGRISKILSKRGAEVYGIDISKEMINIAKKEDLKSKYFVGDISNLPKILKKNKFDLALALLVFLYLDKKKMQKSLIEISKILKKGSTLIIADVHPCSRFLKGNIKSVKYILNKNESYFSDNKVKAKIKRIGVGWTTISYHQHTLSDYINFASKVGFRLLKILEPKPTKKEKLKYKSLFGDEDKIPSYIIFIFVYEPSK
jgi:SAM-dependent methyltransferase